MKTIFTLSRGAFAACAALALFGATNAANAQYYTFDKNIGNGYGSSPGQFNGIEDVALDSSGNVFGSNYFGENIEEFNSSGTYIKSISGGGLQRPIGISVNSSGDLFAANIGAFNVSDASGLVEFNSSTGAYINHIGSGYGNNNGQFEFAQYTALDSSGNLYVSDYSINRVQEFNSNGVFVRSIGSGYGTGNGQTDLATGIALDSSGDIYVASTGNGTITEFDSSGVFVRAFGSMGSGNGQLNTPGGLAVDSAGNVYAADEFNHRVVEFDSSGAFVQNITNSNLASPTGVTFDTSGSLYVADYGKSKIVKFSGSATPAPSSALIALLGAVPLLGVLRKRRNA